MVVERGVRMAVRSVGGWLVPENVKVSSKVPYLKVLDNIICHEWHYVSWWVGRWVGDEVK